MKQCVKRWAWLKHLWAVFCMLKLEYFTYWAATKWQSSTVMHSLVLSSLFIELVRKIILNDRSKAWLEKEVHKLIRFWLCVSSPVIYYPFCWAGTIPFEVNQRVHLLFGNKKCKICFEKVTSNDFFIFFTLFKSSSFCSPVAVAKQSQE